MYWHESIRMTDWFYIYFTENNGMAFGMEIFGKLFLTTFRIVAVGVIGWYLYKIIKKGFKTGYIVCVALILTGALGNIIDSVFYGVLFSMKALIRKLPPSCPKVVDILPGLRKSGGYVLFSDYRYKLAYMDAVCRWRAFHILQSDFQFCRCCNQLRYHCLITLL